MTSFTKIFATLFLVGVLTVSGVACSSSDKSSGSAASTAAWCKKYQAFEDADNGNDDGDVKEFAKMAEDLAKDAPSEIREDIKYLSSAFTELSKIDMEDAGAVKALEKKYDEDKIDKATASLEAFVKDKCNIKTDGN